jgi:hypothetical protein
MPVYRLTWQFQENTGSTFNEVYYVNGSNPTDAATTGAFLGAKRLALLHPLNKILAIRSADVAQPRSTGVVLFNLNGTANIAGIPPSGPCTPGDSVVCTLSGVNGGSRKIWLRGCPDNFILRSSSSGADSPPAELSAALAPWFAALQSNGYGLRQVQPPAAGPLANIKIVSVDGSLVQGQSTITTNVPPTWASGSRVIIGGASKKDLPALNGRWTTIGNVVGSTFVIPYATPENRLILSNSGKVRWENYSAVNTFQASACGFSYFGTRTTKNPISRSRGAKRAVRIRQVS